MRVEQTATRGLWWEIHCEAPLASKAASSVVMSVDQSLPCEPLPVELWQVVFMTAMPRDLCPLRAVCRTWRLCLDDPGNDGLWEVAYSTEWHVLGQGCRRGELNLWRLRFLERWWAHSRWGTRQPTVSTLMGKKAHFGTVTCVALGDFSTDSGEGAAVSASDDGAILMWRFTRAPAGNALAGSPHAVAQQHHRQSQGVDVRCPSRAKQFYGHAGTVWCLAFQPEEQLLLSAGSDGTVKSWSLTGERVKFTLRGHEKWITALRSMDRGRRVVSGGSDGVLKFWDSASERCVHTVGAPEQNPRYYTNCMALLENQGVLFTAHAGMPHLLRRDLETLVPVQCHFGHADDIYAVHEDSASSVLVSGSKDKTVRIWDVRQPQGQCVAVLAAHTGAVLDLKVQGNRVVSGSMDKTVRMWDIRASGAPLTTLEGHSSEVHSVDFHDRMVLSGSRDTALKVWSVV